MNLVGNALKFTKVGGVTIVARPVREGPRAQLAIAVIDTGIGIPPDKLESIFDPFVQADNSVTREFGGTGLGLAICRRIAAALGGTLTVESELGRGSTFTATVDIGSWDDVRILEAPPADGVTPRRHEQPANITQLPPGRIPLVEDGDTNRKLISLILQRAGAEVTTAENGQVAVDLAAQQSFDLILMDMQMPVMDGYTASRRLRQAGVDAPIIALTAHAMKGDDKHCREAGCSGYLTKPVDADQLLCTVADALSVGGGSVGRPTCDGPSAHASVRATGPALISTLPADDPDFREIVEEFVRHLAERLEAMRAAWAARNLHELRHLAHWLKGTGGTAGFPAFNEPARQLEAAAKGGQHAGIEPLIAELTALAARIEISATRCPRTAGSDFGDVLVPRAALVCS
jgi:CheY-like chemotaxis protein